MEQKVTIQELTNLIKEKRALDSKKKEINDVLDEVQAKINELDAHILKSLEQEGLKNFRAPDGLVSIVEKESFSTPKTNEEKRLLFDYIKNKYGEEDLMSKVSINSQTLNSWACDEMETMKLDPIFRIPGLGEPTTYKKLSFRKA